MKRRTLTALAATAAGLLPLACRTTPDSSPPPVIPSGAVPGTLSVEEIRAFLADPAVHRPFVPEAPVGLPEDLSPYIPADNPLTPAKVELGRQLYFDGRLSRDGTVSCASCHHPDLGWTDNRPVSTGIDGQQGGRSAPTVMNRILGKTQFWDGRAASLEEQAMGPVENPIEMGFTFDEAVERLSAIEGYRIQFEAIFGGPPTRERIVQAIAAFERTVLAGDSPYDHYERATPWYDYDIENEEDPAILARYEEAMAGEEAHPLSESALRGRELFFGKANCSACHVGWDLSDEDFHNIGIGMDRPDPDPGRMQVTGDPADLGKFKTPGLHNVADTAPYMHDGSLATLEEVVEHYDRGGTPNANLDPQIFPLNLTEQEKADLVEFMRQGLSGSVTPVEVPRLP